MQGRKSEGPRFQIYLDGRYAKTVYSNAEAGNYVYDKLKSGAADRAYVNKVERVSEYETRKPTDVTVVERDDNGSETPIREDQEIQAVDW